MILKSHLFIPEERFTLQLKHALVFLNPVYAYAVKAGEKTKGLTKYFVLYKKVEVGKKVFYRIPRFTLGKLSELNYLDKTVINPIEINFKEEIKNRYGEKFEFNSSQLKTISFTHDLLLREKGAVIVAETGEGKTSMAIKLISMLKQKTLILVHKETLEKQWKESLLEMTDLTKDDIGSLRQGKFKDGKVVIGSMQSLMRLTINRDVNNLFGLKIADEVHRIGAEQFLKSFTRFNTRYSLGLSATPKREDGLERLYYLHTSEHLVYHRSVRKLNASVFVVKYKRQEKLEKKKKRWTPHRVHLIDNVINDSKRNALLLSLLKKAVDIGRKVVITSERVAHCEMFYKEIKKLYPDKNVLKFWGSALPDKKKKLSADIVIATTTKVSDGEDIPQLDTLIIGTPFGSSTVVTQLKGRIERAHDKKQFPLIIDIHDTNYKFAMFQGLFKKRKKVYVEKNLKFVTNF